MLYDYCVLVLCQSVEEDRARDVERERDITHRHGYATDGETAGLQVIQSSHTHMHTHPDSCQMTLVVFRDCMKVGEVDGKKIGCTVSLLVSHT